MKVLSIFGTRPEAIKMAPVVKRLHQQLGTNAKVCVTAQHRHMLDQILNLFSIQPDYDLNLMKENQDLVYLSNSILKGVTEVLKDFQPDRVIVQGDTSSTLFASMAAFYTRVPIAHVEAGLRSNNLYSPWPEEGNRKITSHLSDFHFAPTQSAADNLYREGIPENRIFITGNTVIDALFMAKEQLNANAALLKEMQEKFSFLDPKKKLILVTGHRRENFGHGFLEICSALAKLAEDSSIQIVYPAHLNPNVQKPVQEMLSHLKNIYLMEPLDYLPFIYLMEKSYLILTDSGGIQEEAPSLGKPVLVMRNVTERPEGILSGTVKLVGTDMNNIIKEVTQLLGSDEHYQKMSLAHNPYGDGKAADRIVKIMTDDSKLGVLR